MRSIKPRKKRINTISATTPHCRICGFSIEPLPFNLVEARHALVLHIKCSHSGDFRGYPFKSDVLLAQCDGLDLHCEFHGSARKAGR